MGALRVLIIIFLPFLIVHGNHICETSQCRFSNIPIRFPFKLPSQPQECGFPGFDIVCNNAGKPILNVPNSGSFSIHDIYYKNQSIELYDQHGCIQSQLLELNLSSSPFQAMYYRNYTFVTCPADAQSIYIECLSNFTSHTIATSENYYRTIMSHKCTIRDSRPIAVSLPNNDIWSLSPFSLLNENLLLKWDSPNCSSCESRGRICGFKDHSKIHEIQCFRDPTQVIEKIRIILISIILPIVFCLSCFLWCKCLRNARLRLPTAQNTMTITAHVSRGLDDSTIESYATVTLGESKRIEGPNGTTCPICLADYLPKDILRCIPECQHCFHVDCIDEWLRLKSMCPLCRNSPSCVGS